MDNKNYPALISVDDLDLAVKYVNNLVNYRPEIHSRIESWYDYWNILEANYKKACSEVKRLERKSNSKLKIADQALKFAEKLDAEKLDAEKLGTERLDTDISIVSSNLFFSKKNSLNESIERIGHAIIEPLGKRLKQLPGIIKNMIFELSEHESGPEVPLLKITSREVMINPDDESIAYILTCDPLDQGTTILLCNAMTQRIPMQKNFFSMDITSSFASPDGISWFDDESRAGFKKFDFEKDWSESADAYIKMLNFYEEPMCSVLSQIPVLINENLLFRIRHASGFEQIEIYRNSGFEMYLSLEEVSMFAGYLIYLKKSGCIDFFIDDK